MRIGNIASSTDSMMAGRNCVLQRISGTAACVLLCEDSAMTTIEHGTRLTRTAALQGFAVRVVNAISNYLRAWKNRREFYRLGEMSDSELADIGLTRTDLHVVAVGPFGLDPTTRLSRIARARTQTMEDIARKVC